MISDKRFDNGRGFDWGFASSDYAKYRDIYPEEFYKRIVDLGYCVSGQRVLDLGTGTGVLPRNMYKYGAEFVGTDISENQIKYAEILSKGMDINYISASAERIDFPANSFDIVTACQCFMYFDKKIIMPKIHKFLNHDGHFLILYMAWLPFESEIAMKSENLVLKYNPAWTGGRMKRYEINNPDYLEGLFEVSNALTYDIDVAFTRESWNGRMKACRGIDASLSADEIAAFEKEHLKMLNDYPERFNIKHFASLLDLKKI
ncbi:MAG: class I SAM-dependent methyltransferase [Eubacterium sp.]